MSSPITPFSRPGISPEDQSPSKKPKYEQDSKEAESFPSQESSPPPVQIGKQIELDKKQIQQLKQAADHAEELVIASAKDCFKNLEQIQLDSIENFAKTVFDNCDVVRRVTDQKAEAQFCDKITSGILKITSEEADKIAKESKLSPEAKAQKMENLKNLAAGLCQLISVQRRFGGSAGSWLAFHNIKHSMAVGIESGRFYKGSPDMQFAAFNAGAAHDSVMRYEAPPALATMSTVGIASRNAFFKIFDARLPLLNEKRAIEKKPPNESDQKRLAEINQELQKTEGEWFRAVKDCYMKGEQKRIAGIASVERDVGGKKEILTCSEQDSAIQFTNYNAEIGAICVKALEKETAALQKFKDLSARDDEFGTKLIQATVPRKANFFFPDGGHKCYTVSNMPLIPDPEEIAKLPEEFGSRLCMILDHAMEIAIANAKPTIPAGLKHVAKWGTYSYRDAVTDINAFRKNPIVKEGEAKFALKSFLLGLANMFAADFPPFNDPIAPFIPLIASGEGNAFLEAYEKALVEALETDMKEHDDKVLSFLKERESLMGIPSSDLHAFVRKGAGQNWSREETFALFYEEQAATVNRFVILDKNIRGRGFPNGLEDETLHETLDKSYATFLQESDKNLETAKANFVAKTGISVTDYQDIQMFIEVAKHYTRDQNPFARGKLTYDEFRNNVGLSALSKALTGSDRERVSVSNHLKGYRESNCEKERLRLEGVRGVEELEAQCKYNGKAFVVKAVYDNMAKRAGVAFRKDPTNFVLTAEKDSAFLKDQDTLTLRKG